MSMGGVIRWCSGTPLLADDGQDIIADARRHSPARRPVPRRSGFCRRAGKALDCPAAPRLAQSQASATAAKSGRAVDAGQRTVRAQIDAVSRAAALDRALFLWLALRAALS